MYAVLRCLSPLGTAVWYLWQRDVSTGVLHPLRGGVFAFNVTKVYQVEPERQWFLVR